MVLRNPVTLPIQTERVPLDSGQAVLPHCQHLVLLSAGFPVLSEAQRPVEELLLDVQWTHLPSTGQTYRAATGQVIADLSNCPDGILQRHVPEDDVGFFQHPQDEPAGPDLKEGCVLTHIGIADDHVQSPEALGVGMGFVSGVDDRAGSRGRARDPLPDMGCPLADTEACTTAGVLIDFSGPRPDLSGHQEWDEDLVVFGLLVTPSGEVVLVAAIGVIGRICVVLEQVDVAVDPLFPQSTLGVDHQLLKNPLAGLVMRHHLPH